MFNCYTAVEFNLTVRSLACFLKANKNVGLVVVDGTHLIENVEMYSVKGSDKYGTSGKGPGKPRGNQVQTMAATEVPTSDDFFGGGGGAVKASVGSTVSG